MSRSGWRPAIESALALDLRRLIKLRVIRDGASSSLRWTDDRGNACGSVGYAVKLNRTEGVGEDSGTLTLTYSHSDRAGGKSQPVTCVLGLCTVPMHYGGLRWYLLCPYTHRRALKLYKFSGIEQFCHRTAIRPLPTYASQRVSGCDRIFAQRWAIRRKLGDTFSDLFSEPYKPKWMRLDTFERYAARDAELAAREGIYMGRLLGRLEAYSKG